LVGLKPGNATIKYGGKAAKWYFRGQITFEVFYFISTVFLVKILNQIVNLCVKTTIQNDYSDGSDDLSYL